MLPLSILEHERCRRPSTILTIYLILAILFDATKARTAWLAWQQTSPRGSLAYPAILVSIGVFKFLILVAESVEKFRWLLPQDGLKYEASHEETGGLLNLGVFFWLNSLFMRGYSNIMHVDQLYPLDRAMSSRHLHDSLSAQRAKSHVHIRYSLAKSLAGSLLLPIAPRIAYIGFTFAQPFFIATLISHLQRTPEPGSTSWYDQGKGLVGATILIYLGAALSRSLYNYLVHRTVYMARGALASAIYEKTTISPDSADVGGGGLAALTLMSTDVERIILGFITIHEVWANPVEVALGCWMLYEKLGLAFFSPLVTIVLCLAAMAWVAKRAAIEQTAWMGRIQARVGLTALAISDLKRLKIAGLDGTIAERIKNLRVEDLHYGSRFRFVQAMTAAISFVPQCIAPIFAFVFGARGLGVEEMFSALSFLVLVTTPLTMFFQSIPLLQSGMACLDRIDKFLVADSRRDHRTCIISCSEQCRGYSIPGSELAETQPDPNSYQMASLSPKPSHSSQPRHTGHSLVSIKDGSFGWTLDKMALKNINLEVRPGQFVVCVGPVASGKSTLCKAIIGEMPFVNGGIEIHPVLSAIAFCDQTPVILAGTIRDNIVRNTPFDSQRYDDVLHATALDQDISLLEAGDGTLLDSGGATLSGGQRNRLALARALYQHTQLLVVDDALSGLDSTTDSLVFQRCFGPQGLLRRRGVAMVFCTHSSRHVGCADHIAVLDDQGRIATQGSLDEVRRLDDYISSYDTEQAEPEEPRGGDTGHSAAAPVPPATSVKAAATSAEDHSRQTGEFQTYKYYLGTIGAPSLALFVLFNIAFAFGLNFSTVWISFWSSDTFHRGFSFYMGMYAFMRILQLAGITAGATIVLVAMVRVSGLQLHQATLKTVMQVPLAVQSAMNVGKVTNYFSQDMTILDVELPISFLNLGAGIFGLFAAAVVIATASPWLVISYPALFGLIWLIQMFYLRTSRQLRLLDLEAKSPL